MTLTICPACGKDTTNPRFCNRSCAAKFNNRKNPKRKPEGKCRVCGQQIPTSKSLCVPCAENEQMRAGRKAQNIRTWTRITDEQVHRVILPADLSAKMVFKSSFSFGAPEQLDSTGKIDVLLDRLTAVCFARPGYLRQCHAARHVVLLNEFRDHKYEQFRGPMVRAGDLPVDDLGPALSSWMTCALRGDFHPLMPSYVLDTITFIQEHVEESYHFRNWKIVPLVKPGRREERIRFINSSFKREFTQQTGTILMLCKVPEGSRIVDAGKIILEAGGRFLSTACRCHLSSGVCDNEWYRCEESNGPAYDLHEDFKFYGSLFARRTSSGVEVLDPEPLLNFPHSEEARKAIEHVFSHFKFHSSGFHTPAHWVEATIAVPSGFGWSPDSEISVIPVPRWQVDFE